MATVTDIYTALVTLCTEVVYPNGTAQPSILGPGVDVTIRPGWPNPDRLDALLAAGNSNVSIYQIPGMQRNVSRYSQYYLPLSYGTPTMTLTAVLAARTVTVGGTITAGQKASVTVNGINYIYITIAGDTTTTVATALAALIPGASSAANMITIPSAYKLSVRVGVTGQVIQELKRQQNIFQVMVYASTFGHRFFLAKRIEIALAKNFYLSLADDIDARIIWKASELYDQFQKLALYQACLKYEIEYATTEVTDAEEINFTLENLEIYQGQLP